MFCNVNYDLKYNSDSLNKVGTNSLGLKQDLSEVNKAAVPPTAHEALAKLTQTLKLQQQRKRLNKDLLLRCVNRL